MSDQENQVGESVQDSAAMAALELETLKSKATLMGVKFHPAIGYDALSAKIKEHEANQATGTTPVALAKGDDVPPSKSGKIKAMRDEALALVRVNITCMNPAKREWNGEIITVSNRNIPTQKKMVPFNTTDGYHIPKIMYDLLVARECPVFYDERVKTASGFQTVRRMKRIKEFGITVLPQLTPAELKELARQQAAAQGIE